MNRVPVKLHHPLPDRSSPLNLFGQISHLILGQMDILSTYRQNDMIRLLIILQTGFDNCHLTTNPRCEHLQHVHIQKFIQPIQRFLHLCIRLQTIHLIILQQQIFRILKRRETKRDISCRIFTRNRL